MTQDKGEALEMMTVAVAQLPQSLRDIAARINSPVLHSACVAGELDLVRGLLDAGLAGDMYPCSEDEDDEPPLTWIARYRDKTYDSALSVAKLLIDRGAGVDEGLPLLAAAENDDLHMMQLLLEAGADKELVIDEAGPEEIELIENLIAQARARGSAA